jgi:hypothetical protein
MPHARNPCGPSFLLSNVEFSYLTSQVSQNIFPRIDPNFVPRFSFQKCHGLYFPDSFEAMPNGCHVDAGSGGEAMDRYIPIRHILQRGDHSQADRFAIVPPGRGRGQEFAELIVVHFLAFFIPIIARGIPKHPVTTMSLNIAVSGSAAKTAFAMLVSVGVPSV